MSAAKAGAAVGIVLLLRALRRRSKRSEEEKVEDSAVAHLLAPGAPTPVVQVDAFADEPFEGNPAAVVVRRRGEALDDELQAAIAAEMNLSETAFVVPLDSDGVDASRFSLRWFTPAVEVPLCGHATLATAATLFYLGATQKTLTFETKSGDLHAERVGERGVAMELPLNEPVVKQPSAAVQLVVSAIVGESTQVKEVAWNSTTGKLLVVLDDSSESRATLEALQPDTAAAMAVKQSDVRGVIVSVAAAASGTEGEYDFLSRYFAPWVGIPEDPVTGSAHTVLAAYWAKQLGKTTLRARQCSPRGGDLCIDVRFDDARVRVVGQAAIVFEGSLKL